MNGAAEFMGRLAQLDAALSGPPSVARCLDHFVRVMQHVTFTSPSRWISANAEMIDDCVVESRLLNEIRALAPSIADGPLDRGHQYWIGTGKPAHVPALGLTPIGESFIDIVEMPDDSGLNVKPFGAGLFSSTGGVGDYGQWHRYLEMQGDSALFRRPWSAWRLTPSVDARVAELKSARQWVDLVCSYPKKADGYLTPDWVAVGEDFDAVHVSLGAVLATQGLSFATDQGRVAAPYWDVESTFWLHWRFSDWTSCPLRS